jgi:hypothetical protein
MANKFYSEIKNLRGKDKYPDNYLEEHLVDNIFPDDPEAMALKLSNVTAGFYGFILKHTGMQCGWDKVDTVSKSLFRELGNLKAAEAVENGVEIPKDTRSLAIVFVTAVFTSSPEYNFEFTKYTPEETIMRIFGVCRYYRIAKKLNIESYLTWPTLTAFFEGIAEYFGIECDINMEVCDLHDNGECDYLAKFVLKKK